MYKHVIWDFDGTLFDSYPAMGSAFKKVLEDEGFEESLEEILKYMKVSMSTAFEHYSKRYHINNEFIVKLDKYRKVIENDLCKPFEGIEKLCKYICESGKSNYLYTHRGESAIGFLKKYNLYDYFSDCITSQNGFERKPSPNAINYLIEKYNISRDEAIMVGDRELDILSAENAGIHGCFFSEVNERSSTADFIINNFQQLYSILAMDNSKRGEEL